MYLDPCVNQNGMFCFSKMTKTSFTLFLPQPLLSSLLFCENQGYVWNELTVAMCIYWDRRWNSWGCLCRNHSLKSGINLEWNSWRWCKGHAKRPNPVIEERAVGGSGWLQEWQPQSLQIHVNLHPRVGQDIGGVQVLLVLAPHWLLGPEIVENQCWWEWKLIPAGWMKVRWCRCMIRGTNTPVQEVVPCCGEIGGVLPSVLWGQPGATMIWPACCHCGSHVVREGF